MAANVSIPTILKGDDSGAITIGIASGRSYTGAVLIVAYQGVTRTYENLVAGGTVSLAFTHEETQGFALGCYPLVMRLVGATGSEETVENGEARIKVTDCLGEVNAGGSFILRPGEQGGGGSGTDEDAVHIEDFDGMDTLGDAYTLGQVKSKVNEILRTLKGERN